MTNIENLYQFFLQHPAIATDTRKINNGDIFFALKGPSFNGNQFAKQALEAGASLAVVDEVEYAINEQYFLVEDVLTTLQLLAKHHRQQFNIPFIAITGSNGKTTTKELVSTVIASTYTTYTTQGNLNNHIGVPLTILQIKKDAQMAVIEMGANHQKEIASYCNYTLPTHGLITNVGKAHLEGFGGEEGVKKGKGELFDFLRENNGIAFACDDFEYFQEMTKGLPEVHWYGTKKGETIGRVEASEPFLKASVGNGLAKFMIDTKLVGAYNIYNVLSAVAIGKYFNVPNEKIKAAIENYTPGNSRSQMIEKDGNHIILDAYNANPSSMGAAIENFAKLKVENKILFLGAMMELGPQSKEEHEHLIDLIGKYKWKSVVLVGGDFNHVFHPYQYFENSRQAAEWWQALHSKGNYLLIKGSRSIKMEQILNVNSE
jgi:UDP-N-acetylmuramoyl-tripeptide--D-alanyl-D-alanine ligase